ncbi:heparan-alpha-glucosaminide N-acetyltransferase domain-containing protein [Microbacterium sp. SS28]|uniref:heparan-alpha-glucosaminide N-acetyltransferase domain-containing protein n=1 Tax=Microbacterium sp. SS28 TaxID=2919948 RepID=UPI001FAA5C16|nr:heparan-alpha-glucosaminide N-acetyltransferase domain-containing protein [Microbacterium sp. SS28]
MDADAGRAAPTGDAAAAAPARDDRLGAVVEPVAPRTQPGRLVVPDVLRGIAILAMLIAHAAPLVRSLPFPVLFVQSNVNDLASPLFALVMGMSTALVVRRAGPLATNRALVVGQNLIRGLILVALGMWLSTWGSWIAIVLSFLGLVLMIGTPLLLLSTRTILVIAAVVVVLSQPVNALVGSLVTAGGDVPLALLPVDWMFTNSHYRVTNLLPFFLVGAALLRHGFRRDPLLLGIFGAALIAYPLRPLYDVVAPALGTDALTYIAMTRSGSWLDTLHDVGLVFLTYSAVVALATVRSPRAARITGAVFVPFRALGSVALSVYVLQVGVVAIMAATPLGFDNRWLEWLILVGGVSAAGILWWRFVGKGPVEWAIGVVSGRYRMPRRRRP